MGRVCGRNSEEQKEKGTSEAFTQERRGAEIRLVRSTGTEHRRHRGACKINLMGTLLRGRQREIREGLCVCVHVCVTVCVGECGYICV